MFFFFQKLVTNINDFTNLFALKIRQNIPILILKKYVK